MGVTGRYCQVGRAVMFARIGVCPVGSVNLVLI